jgi:hypothetical protein
LAGNSGDKVIHCLAAALLIAGLRCDGIRLCFTGLATAGTAATTGSGLQHIVCDIALVARHALHVLHTSCKAQKQSSLAADRLLCRPVAFIAAGRHET